MPTSSAGRLFDAVSALIGLREVVTFEAEAAIELEKIAADIDEAPYAFRLDTSGDVIQIDPAPVLRGLIADGRSGVSAAILSGRFHRAAANALIEVTLIVREQTGINTAALSGGVWQNRLLRRLVEPELAARGLTVLTHQQVPPSDAGLALGQMMIGQQM